MIEDIQTNEQKLDAIYRIVKAQESRATRAKWFRLLKWIIILAIAYFVAQNPTFLLEKMTEYIMPAVMENMQQQMTGSGGLLDQVQGMIPSIR